jgi:hypothetical protein
MVSEMALASLLPRGWCINSCVGLENFVHVLSRGVDVRDFPASEKWTNLSIKNSSSSITFSLSTPSALPVPLLSYILSRADGSLLTFADA